MGAYGLMFRRHVPRELRMQAFTNLACTCYMTLMTLGITHISFFHIVPACYYGHDDVILRHRMVMWYIFTSVVGNFVTCMVTETKPKRKSNKLTKQSSADGAAASANGTPKAGANSSLERHLSIPSAGGEARQRIKEVSDRDEEEQIADATNAVNGNAGGNNDNENVVKEEDKDKELNAELNNIKKLNYCMPCDLEVHRRTHHCYLCEKCIVKRDHHCFFIGVCIGRSNHIYFIFFCLYMGMGTFYALMLIAKYMYLLYGVQFHGPQTFVTLFINTLLLLFNGQMPSVRYMGLFVFLYVSLAATTAAFGFFCWNILIILRGQTSYEARRGVRRYCRGSYLKNFQAVFNLRSIVSLLVPFWDLVTETNYCRIKRSPIASRTANMEEKKREQKQD